MKKIILSLILTITFLLSSCAEGIKKEEYTFYAMDTFISLTLYNVKDSDDIAKTIENIYLKYDSVANDYQTKDTSISVYDLNIKREGIVSEELKELLEYSLEMFKETNGYFNPFIGRLSHLWKDALGEKKLVEDTLIQNELEIMNEGSLEITGNKVRLIGEANIDLGGIAKGYATSKVVSYLESIDCKNYLLNAGNSTIALGSKAGNPFKVGISKALDSGYLTILNIKDKVISTSSIKEQNTKIDGIYYSHLLNPKTGYPANFYDAISIIGEDSKALDAYSTACFSMEIEELEKFLNEHSLDFIVSKNNQIISSSKGVNSYA
ncbi:MAG: FAD:protein FMN transferase [Anaeroplasmataceae bacterium]|nr:FAD:protein FMN transferase [Anaeroplasmataceae bacterium]